MEKAVADVRERIQSNVIFSVFSSSSPSEKVRSTERDEKKRKEEKTFFAKKGEMIPACALQSVREKASPPPLCEEKRKRDFP